MYKICSILLIVGLSLFDVVGLRLENNHIKIVSVKTSNVSVPYLYEDENKTGNDRFTGIIPDLVKAIFETLDLKRLNSSYEIYLSPDGQYGAFNNTSSSWNGTVNEILKGNADLAVADLTITPVRTDAVDFTLPWYDLGLNILVLKPEVSLNLWRIFDPFSNIVWLILVITLFIMSGLIYFGDRCSPYGYHDSDRKGARFNLSSSVLGTTYIFLGKDFGSGRSWASKILMVSYMMFCYVIIAYYNAELTASLTVQKITPPVTQLSDLAKPKNTFCIRDNSAGELYFRLPGNEMYLPQMIEGPSYKVCLNLLRSGAVQAVIGDSVTQSSIANNPPYSDLIVGDVFYPSPFGIALAYSNDSANEKISQAILIMRENGVIQQIMSNWLDGLSEKSNLDSNQLTLLDVAGAFILLAAFVIWAFVSLVLELSFDKWWEYHEGTSGSLAKHIYRFFGGEKDVNDQNNNPMKESD